jgi:hypothetical protein
MRIAHTVTGNEHNVRELRNDPTLARRRKRADDKCSLFPFSGERR